MKCPHCGKDIPEKLVTSEAARIHRRKAKKKLSSEDAKDMANKRWDKKNSEDEINSKY